MESLKNCTIRFPKKPESTTPQASNPFVFFDRVSDSYYLYCDGKVIYSSSDLLSWEEHPVSDLKLCYPGVIKYKHEYRLYNTKITKRKSKVTTSIELYISHSPTGPFTLRDTVLSSSDMDEVTAMDASPVMDERTEEFYLIYGCHKGGIFALPLENKTGLSKTEGFGVCISRRPKWASYAVSSAMVTYNPNTNYYYLMETYGFTGEDSNIRVGRSRQIVGPYEDSNGRCLLDIDDFQCQVGFMPLASYRFDCSSGFVSPSSPSLLHNPKNSWYVAHQMHPYEDGQVKKPILQVREIKWSANGWPLFSAETFAGEHTQDMKPEWVVGRYEFVKFIPTLPQGILDYVSLKLLAPDMERISNTKENQTVSGHAMGRVELGGCMRGSWKFINATTLEISYCNYVENYRILPAWDSELNQPTIILTGKDNLGRACFAKKFD